MDRRAFLTMSAVTVAGAATAAVSVPAVANAVEQKHLVIDTVRGPLGPITEPTLIEFVGDGRIVVPEDGTWGIRIESSGVTIRNAVIAGPGSTWPSQNRQRDGIWIAGAPGSPFEDVVIEGGRIEGFGYAGVLVDYAKRITISGVTIRDIAYAGILMLSAELGTVEDCDVSGLTQVSYKNSYGIAVTRDWNHALDLAPRSHDIDIVRNRVADVQQWEGIDTHGGVRISIRENVVTNCATGIALVPLVTTGGGIEDAAPLDCDVVGNVIRWTTDGPRTAMRAGINFVGAGQVPGDDGERATGTIRDNVIAGYGDNQSGGTLVAGMLVYCTRGLAITDNTVESGVGRGILLYHSNDEATVSANCITALTPRGPDAYASAIDIRFDENDVTITGNRAFAAAPPADQYRVGVYAPGSDSTIRVGGNDWGSARYPFLPAAQKNEVIEIPV